MPSLSSSSILKPKLSPCPRCPHPLLVVSGSDPMSQPVSYTANSACLGLQAGLQTSFDSFSHSEMVNLLFFTYYCSSSPLHFADSHSDHCSTRPFNLFFSSSVCRLLLPVLFSIWKLLLFFQASFHSSLDHLPRVWPTDYSFQFLFSSFFPPKLLTQQIHSFCLSLLSPSQLSSCKIHLSLKKYICSSH